MMKIFKLTLFAAFLAVIAVACSKDQKVVKQLADGPWEVTEMKVNGTEVDQSEFADDEYTFEKCKVKKEDCEGSYSTNDPSKGEITYSFTYSIQDDGETIIISLTYLGTPIGTQTGEILENTGDLFSWEYTDDFGDVVTTTIEKI